MKHYGAIFPAGAQCIAARGHETPHCAHALDGALDYFRYVDRASLEQMAGPVAASVRELSHVLGLSLDDTIDLIADVLDGAS